MRRAGEMFGLAEVLEAPLRRAGAQTLTPSVLHEMDRRELELFCEPTTRSNWHSGDTALTAICRFSVA